MTEPRSDTETRADLARELDLYCVCGHEFRCHARVAPHPCCEDAERTTWHCGCKSFTLPTAVAKIVDRLSAALAAKEAAEAEVTAQQIRGLSEWIDNGPSYVGLDSEAHTWRRLGKVGEEFGEAIEAWLGVIGENQRKGPFGSMDDVNLELLDVATCALGAVEHNTGNEGRSMVLLAAHIASRFERAGLAAAAPSEPQETP